VQILLIRHAHAGEHDPARWPDDTLRPLSDQGRRRHRRVAKRLRRRGVVPTLVLSSPWLRAWQTALLTAELTGAPEPVATEALAEPPSAGRVAAAAGPQGPDAVLALVGHEPWLGELASLLLAGDAQRVTVDFPKSGVLGLSADSIGPGGATLEFFWRPKGS
jgi:phosphohistidine phosphatase